MELKEIFSQRQKLLKILLAVAAFAALFLAGFYFWNAKTNRESLPPGIAQEPGAGKSAKNLSYQIPLPMPNLDEAPRLSANLDESAKKLALENIKRVSGELRKDPSSVENWLVLGIYKKTLGDYKGAIEVWEYASRLEPENPIPYNNLADLYSYFDKDYVMAEKNWLKALETGPDQAYIYKGAFDFFHFVKKDDKKAREIVERGMSENPPLREYLGRILGLLDK